MDGMDHLLRTVTEMKLSMEIIDGYNENTKDYCSSLIERVKRLKEKKEELNSMLEQCNTALQEQEELKKGLEEQKVRLMSLQNVKLPKGAMTESADLSGNDQEEISKGVTNIAISPRMNNTGLDSYKMKDNFNPVLSRVAVAEESPFNGNSNLGFANSTFIKRDITSVTPKPRRDLEISISFVTNEQFSQIPSYMRGRTTLDNINEFVNIFNVTLNKKYGLIQKAKKFKSKPDLEQCLIWKEQEVGELKQSYFCTADDLDKLGNIKIGHKKYLGIITMLRHLKCIKEVRVSKVIYYQACF